MKNTTPRVMFIYIYIYIYIYMARGFIAPAILHFGNGLAALPSGEEHRCVSDMRWCYKRTCSASYRTSDHPTRSPLSHKVFCLLEFAGVKSSLFTVLFAV
jgi:hypothetical protein